VPTQSAHPGMLTSFHWLNCLVHWTFVRVNYYQPLFEFGHGLLVSVNDGKHDR
jgi:hypothetical protein